MGLNVTRGERILGVLVIFVAAYRTVKGEWPVAIEVDDA